ncbi:MAG: hypothetical protein ACJAWL_001669 [Motiliproteus sp.]|jgi:hypothetical protein
MGYKESIPEASAVIASQVPILSGLVTSRYTWTFELK